MLNAELWLVFLRRPLKNGKTAEIQAVQGVVSTAQGAYLAYVTKPHGATTRKCDVYTSVFHLRGRNDILLASLQQIFQILLHFVRNQNTQNAFYVGRDKLFVYGVSLVQNI